MKKRRKRICCRNQYSRFPDTVNTELDSIVTATLYSLSRMVTLSSALPWVQIALSGALIAAILLQRSDEGGLGTTFGGGGGGGNYYTRRGIERILFIGTIVIAILFGLTSLAALLV